MFHLAFKTINFKFVDFSHSGVTWTRYACLNKITKTLGKIHEATVLTHWMSSSRILDKAETNEVSFAIFPDNYLEGVSSYQRQGSEAP